MVIPSAPSTLCTKPTALGFKATASTCHPASTIFFIQHYSAQHAPGNEFQCSVFFSLSCFWLKQPKKKNREQKQKILCERIFFFLLIFLKNRRKKKKQKSPRKISFYFIFTAAAVVFPIAASLALATQAK